jgi:uncharacterized membrane protein
MDKKIYRRLRIGIAFFTSVIISIAVSLGNIVLAAAGILTACVFLAAVRAGTDIPVDEREKMVREKAALMAYSIFTPTIGFGALGLILLARGEYYFLEAIGIVLAYLSLFLIFLYAASHYYYNRKHGGNGKE